MQKQKAQNKESFLQSSYDIREKKENNLFGNRLRKARQEKGWSIRALAEKLSDYNIHLQTSAVTRWKLGMSIPNVYQLFALCRLLDIEDGIRYFSGPLHPGENSLNEEGLKKLEGYRKDLIASGNYNDGENTP